tara:strand:+ start:324 stop:431 length:108 start_codon:yes stop_codon:yes gene_type:complete
LAEGQARKRGGWNLVKALFFDVWLKDKLKKIGDKI